MKMTLKQWREFGHEVEHGHYPEASYYDDPGLFSVFQGSDGRCWFVAFTDGDTRHALKPPHDQFVGEEVAVFDHPCWILVSGGTPVNVSRERTFVSNKSGGEPLPAERAYQDNSDGEDHR